MSVALALDGGGEAEIVESDGERAVLLSTRPFPPGATLSGTAPAIAGPFLVKVRGSRREVDGRFRVNGRHVNLSRAQRELVVARR